jgi:inhibitor of KinA sporulation pathway (predicted exonuclease)
MMTVSLFMFHEISQSHKKSFCFFLVVVDAKTLSVVDEFHHYILPDHHPTLTPFCKQLTGITQQQVDQGISMRQALQLAEQFLKQYDNGVFVTCGHWDLRQMLRSQATHLNYRLAPIFKQWINIKITCQAYLKWPKQQGMAGMLRGLGLKLVGRHHSGIDDARNIASIVVELCKNGIVLQTNS